MAGDGVDLEKLARVLLDEALECSRKHEDNIRIRAEYILRKHALDPLGIPWATYEYVGRYARIRGRADALYGHVILEYERPGALAKRQSRAHAYSQAERYIADDAGSRDHYGDYRGVVLDGFQIGFVRHSGGKWVRSGPFAVNKSSVGSLLRVLIGLRRKPLRADLLASDLGPASKVSRALVPALYSEVVSTKSPRVQTLFSDWRIVFEQTCGFDPAKVEPLRDLYGVKAAPRVDPERLLFCVHTYYALVMKLIASEVASHYAGGLIVSYIRRLEDAATTGDDALLSTLSELETGGIFSELGLRNFLEADYFGWYVDATTPAALAGLRDLVAALSDYDPGTTENDPRAVRDLTKDLYQYLIPGEIRYQLGEYYTPDWLAELVLDEVGFDGASPRILDPACGSGTFLVQAIQRVKEHAKDDEVPARESLDRVLSNVVGYDLNPLAVIASRTNYLLALGELIRERGPEGIEIPVYLANSILVGRQPGLAPVKLYTITTTVGSFSVPARVVDEGRLDLTLSVMEGGLHDGAGADVVVERISHKYPFSEEEADVLIELYRDFAKLERQGKNGIWTKVIKNSFAPLYKGKFDYVVGNPPWIGWESLPPGYRENVKAEFERFGLLKTLRARGQGEVKKELALLFAVVGIRRYLKDNGSLGFLMPFTVFKAPSEGEFRAFLARESSVRRVHDLVAIQPFGKQVTNRTSLLLLSKGRATAFPIQCRTWTYKDKRPPKMDEPASALRDVLPGMRRVATVLTPIEGPKATVSPWMIAPAAALSALEKVRGDSGLEAHEGVKTGMDGAFIMKSISTQPGGLLVENDAEAGRWPDLPAVQGVVEPPALYPCARGADVQRWRCEPSAMILLPHQAPSGDVMTEAQIQRTCPGAFRLLHRLKPHLLKRSIHQSWGQGAPFYSVYGIGSYTFKPYKVAWPDTAGKISGKATFQAAVLSSAKRTGLGSKLTIPLATAMFIPCQREDEAHYVCALLNSSPSRLLIASYASDRHVAAQIPHQVHVPRFDPGDAVHAELAKLSRAAHRATKAGSASALVRIERKLDRLACKVWGLNRSELDHVVNGLAEFQK